jgi:hypothetical protein
VSRYGDDRCDDERLGAGRPARGDHPGIRKFLARATVGRDRAFGTARVFREADRLAQLHEGLVELARSPGGEAFLGPSGEPAMDRGPPRILSFEGPPSDHPESVGVQRHHRFIEREARHRRGNVRADPGQAPKLGHSMRELALGVTDQPDRRLPKVPGPGVVPGTFPGLEHTVF